MLHLKTILIQPIFSILVHATEKINASLALVVVVFLGGRGGWGGGSLRVHVKYCR